MTLALAANGTIAVAGPTAVKFALFGDEIATTIDAFKTLAQGSVSVSPTVVYTATAVQAIVKTITLFNTAGTSSAVAVYVNGTTAAFQIYAANIPAGGAATYGQDGWRITDSSGSTVTSATVVISGDASGSGPASNVAITLATVNANVGSFGSASSSLAVTVNAKGLVTSLASQAILITESQVTGLVSDLSAINSALSGKQPVGNYITALTGDGTATGPGSVAFTLATVNANVGSFGSASSVMTQTVNAKGLTTAAASVPIVIAESQVTNLVTDLAGKQPTGNYLTALTGDGTASGPGPVAFTLATVNGAPGLTGDASHTSAVTTNAKGLVTSNTSVLISIANTQVTGLGTLSTQSGTFSGTHSGSSSGTNTGDQTLPTLVSLGAVPTSRLINTTAPLTGGGDLSADRTLAISPATISAPGSMSAIDKKKLGVWTDLVNELGADPTGNTDATAIITAWLGTITTGTLFLPPGCRVRVDGPVAWNKEANFVGGERRTSILSCGNATNNMFNVSSDGVTFENLRFSAGAAGVDNSALRTAGYAVNMDNTSDSSGVRRCDILFQWSGVHSSGSLQFMEDLNIREYGNNAINGQCILIDGIGDRYIRRITTDNGSNPTGFAGVRVQTCASLVMSDCNIIHAGNALELSPGSGQTVPSVEVQNCFLDTSVNGLAVVPTGTGVVARCKFTGVWFGTHTTNGILLANPGGATPSFEGLQFINCEIYGTPIGINASAGGGKWEFNGAIAGCTTEAVLLGPSATHFPKIHNSIIGPHGLFGANALGIVVNAGTYKGLIINDNSVVNNTGAALTLGAVTVAAGEAGFFRIIDNAGINPKGAVTTPVYPATTVVVTNTTGFRCQVMHKLAATTTTALTLNGVATIVPNVIQTISYMLEPAGTVAIAFTGTAGTWTWVGQ